MHAATIRRMLILLLGLATAQNATAVPVTLATRVVYDHHYGLDLDISTGGNETFGDATEDVSCGCPKGLTYEQVLANEFGSSSIKTIGTYDVSVSATDNSVTWSGWNKVDAYASVDAALTSGYAFALAGNMAFDLFMTVYEPVQFNGPSNLYDSSAGSVLSGSVFQIGDYQFRTNLIESVIAEAHAGDNLHSSATQSASYHFTAVPVPQPLALVLAGLACMLISRSLRRKLSPAV